MVRGGEREGGVKKVVYGPRRKFRVTRKIRQERRRGNFKHSFIDGPDGFCSTKSPEGGVERGKEGEEESVNRATRRTLSTIEEL